MFWVIYILRIGGCTMLPRHVIKVHVKNVKQEKEYTCGVSALRSILLYYGIKASEKEMETLAKSTYENGTDTKDLVRVARYYGLRTRCSENMSLENLKKWLDKKRPTILCIQRPWSNYYIRNLLVGHYVVAIGYDEKCIYFEDPIQDKGYRGCIPTKEFMKRWKDQDSDRKVKFRWGLAVWKDNHPIFPQRIYKVKKT